MAARDRAAFADFVTARSHALHRTAYLLVGDVGLAQDLVQEALTRTYVAWPRLRRQEAAEAYTRKAIATIAIDWFRRRSWGERPSDALPDAVATGHGDAAATRQTLLAALAQLPPRQRAVIVLRYYEDLTEPQTATAPCAAVGSPSAARSSPPPWPRPR